MELNREKISIVMARQELTVTELANRYGISRTRLNVILNSRKVTCACAGRLAKALDCDVTEIINQST